MTGLASDLPWTQSSILVTVSGRDRPGVASWLLGALDPLGFTVLDVEQIQVHGRLLLCCELAPAPAPRPAPHSQARPDSPGGQVPAGRTALSDACGAVRATLDTAMAVLSEAPGADGLDLDVRVRAIQAAPDLDSDRPAPPDLVTVLAPQLDAGTLGTVFGAVSAASGNIVRIGRLSSYPVVSYELEVAGAEPDALRRLLGTVAAERGVDVAVQRAGLHRRAKHLIVLDADSTLLQGEVIDLLARRAGCHEEVAAVTAAAMAGRLDFAESLRRRLALLAGLTVDDLVAVTDALVLTPGARTLVRTLRRLGYVTAVVSGGFTQVIDPVAEALGIDYVAANTLEVADGRLTGGLVGAVVDRAGKAAALRRFAREAGVPMSRTIAVGDGANDVDMLAAAGLGIAFNAHPVVRGAADAAINVPYLDAILFLLGMSRREIEAADTADAADAEPTAPSRGGSPDGDGRPS